MVNSFYLQLNYKQDNSIFSLHKNKILSLLFAGIVLSLSLLAAVSDSAYATDPSSSASGSAQLRAKVGTAIAMNITGNDDGTACRNAGFDSCSTFGSMLPNSFSTTTSTISVYTNSTEGYYLSVRAANNQPELKTSDKTYSIPTGTLSSESGGQNKWSYKTDSTGVKTTWTAMTTTDVPIKGTSIYGATDSTTTVTYELSTGSDSTSGKYSTELIYTATAPNDTAVVEPNPVAKMQGDNVTFSATSVPVTVGGTGTVTITPAEGYYLDSLTCTHGYTTNATTGTSATSAQTVTITNPNVTRSAICTAVTKEKVYMQDIATICPTLNEGDDPVTLIDARDNQEYKVFKAKDGNCWMGENLRFGINPDGTGHPFTSADIAGSDSNLNSTKMLDLTYDSSNPNTAGRIKNGSSGMKTADNSANAFANNTEGYTEPYINIYQANNTGTDIGWTSGNDKDYKFGVLYNYCAVTGGTVCNSDAMSADAPASICPKGWKLPGMTATPTGSGATTDGTVKTYNNLFNAYGVTDSSAGFNKITPSPLSFVRAGRSYDGSLYNRSSSEHGLYWSSTKYTSTGSACHLRFNSSSVSQSNSYRFYGRSSRCVSE